MRVLFLSGWFPYPPSNGSKLRIYNLLRQLSHRHEITLLTFADRPDADVEAPALRALCGSIEVVPWKAFEPRSWRARVGVFSPAPRSVVDTHSAEMAGRIERAVARGCDVVVASEVTTAGYARHFRGRPALFDEVEVAALCEPAVQARSPWRRFRARLTWAKHRRYLAGLLRQFAACTVVSARERELLASAAPGYAAVEVIPNCVNLPDYDGVSPDPRDGQLIFTGSITYAPNRDGLTWFLTEVYPRIRAELPNVRLTITGDGVGLPLPPAPNVEQTGMVDDVRPLIANACVSLAPIHAGGGTRLKILEAMALGTPVVATSKGAEGLEVTDGDHLLLADTPETFAAQVLRLLRAPDLRRALSTRARRLVEERYDWRIMGPRFEQLVMRVAGHSDEAAPPRRREHE